jgi:hypothetical protein
MTSPPGGATTQNGITGTSDQNAETKRGFSANGMTSTRNKAEMRREPTGRVKGCPCGHFFDEDCVRHLPIEGTGARYKAARKWGA